MAMCVFWKYFTCILLIKIIIISGAVRQGNLLVNNCWQQCKFISEVTSDLIIFKSTFWLPVLILFNDIQVSDCHAGDSIMNWSHLSFQGFKGCNVLLVILNKYNFKTQHYTRSVACFSFVFLLSSCSTCVMSPPMLLLRNVIYFLHVIVLFVIWTG